MSSDKGPIAVTGASGLLGANLVLELARRKGPVVALYGCNPIVIEGVRSAACDLTDRPATQRLLGLLAPSLVIHCAAATNVDWCETHPRACLRINAEAAGDLAGQARAIGAAFVYISTDSVFDGVSGGYRETDPVAPVNSYARSKVAGEAAVRRAMPQALVLRVNLYGWDLQGRQRLAEWILSRLEGGQPVPGFRDVTFAPVLANQLAGWILDLTEADCAGIYHVASSDPCSKYDFARQIAEVFHLDPSLIRESRLEVSARSAPRPHHTWLRTEKVTAALGRSMPSIREGLEEFRALRENGFFQRLKAAATG